MCLDLSKMRAKDLHELLPAWANYHRIVAEARMRHIQTIVIS